MRIVVGNDGRPHSEKAAEYAFKLAKAFQATLFMLYIVSPKAQEEKDKNIKNGMRVLGRAKIHAADLGVELATLLEAGEPHETLLLAANKLSADAIVVGASGEKTGMAKLLGSSTSETIYKNSPCTVILVK